MLSSHWLANVLWTKNTLYILSIQLLVSRFFTFSVSSTHLNWDAAAFTLKVPPSVSGFPSFKKSTRFFQKPNTFQLNHCTYGQCPKQPPSYKITLVFFASNRESDLDFTLYERSLLVLVCILSFDSALSAIFGNDCESDLLSTVIFKCWTLCDWRHPDFEWFITCLTFISFHCQLIKCFKWCHVYSLELTKQWKHAVLVFITLQILFFFYPFYFKV